MCGSEGSSEKEAWESYQASRCYSGGHESTSDHADGDFGLLEYPLAVALSSFCSIIPAIPSWLSGRMS